ncbi:CopD family protein [Niveibacterium sp. 24ML]|uniref:CopD family protein n=1 Tax=Niveibacterium sp. 24ML TaxID=2985512 RepID=UPI002271BE23|nr:CopD family protein [Niveibacterium sp. 24ML]MCX9157457.1 CopD family protein [Niveibacterium sp. 24ML]
MMYMWLKAFHAFFVVSWFAGLFYLPRIFVNLAMVPADSHAERERLLLMARKLKRFMLPLMIGTWIFGLAMIFYGGKEAAYGWMSQGWLHAKLFIVLLLTGYDGYCSRLLRDFAAGRNTKSHVWFRVFNELPALALLFVVILVIVKPF